MVGPGLPAQYSTPKSPLVTVARAHAITGAQMRPQDLRNAALSSLSSIMGTTQVHVPRIPAPVRRGWVVHVMEGKRTFAAAIYYGGFPFSIPRRTGITVVLRAVLPVHLVRRRKSQPLISTFNLLKVHQSCSGNPQTCSTSCSSYPYAPIVSSPLSERKISKHLA